jgi:transmembrane sensor
MSERFTPEDGEELPFEFKRKAVPPGKQQQQWELIESSIQKSPAVKWMGWRRNLAIAASLLLLIASGIWYMQKDAQLPTNLYTTDFAQVKNITLPDGSKVILNANSELKLTAEWGEEGNRQVWLEGEAYFEVEKKTATHQKFIVHTKDLDVEVLGTRFNVNTRHAKAVVSLEEGKIKLIPNIVVKSTLQNKFREEVIEMKPGQLVKLDTASGINLTSESNINVHSGWVRNEFHFDNTSLKEIGIMIKDIYGYTLVSDNEQLLQRTVTGDLRAANLQELVDVLQLAIKLKMTIENKSIKISQR